MPAEPPAGESEFSLGDPNEFLDAVGTVLEVFGLEGIAWKRAATLDASRAGQLLANPPVGAARMGLMTTAAVIRWAAHETGRAEQEILDELRRSLTE